MKKKAFTISAAVLGAMAAAGCSFESGRLDSMIAGFDGGVKKTWESEYKQGKERLASGYYGLALQRFKSALDRNPQSDRVMNALAVTYDRLGRYDLAQLYYDRALAIAPDSPTTLNNIGYSMLTRGRYEEALVYFERALKLRREPDDTRMIVANRHLAMDRLRVARQRQDGHALALASATAVPEPGRDGCTSQGAGAVERTGRRVFTLVTGPDGAPRDRNCGAQQHSRVAILHTETSPVGLVQAASAPADPAPAAREVVATEAVVTPASVAKPEKALAPALKVEVSNGAGRNKLAARMRAYLESKGLPVSYLTNAASFDHRETTIFYKPGRRAAAERFAKLLPIAVELVQAEGYYADIRIELGADILEFDKRNLYAANNGERDA